MSETKPLEELITVIITTSPSPSQPSTELLMQVMQSMAAHAPVLWGARVIIVCDGYKMTEKVQWRSARVDDSGKANYEEYKSRLRDMVAATRDKRDGGAAENEDKDESRPSTEVPDGFPPHAEVLELETNHGFGFAVRAALKETYTPLVCVIQHDRVFKREAPVEDAARCLLDMPEKVGYILLPTRSTQNYALKMATRLGERGVRGKENGDITKYALPLAREGQRLLPCLMWYDSTHLCSVSYYRDFIYSEDEKLVKRGGFIEGELGQLQLPEFAEKGIAAALARWRTFLLDDGTDEPMVGHLDGKRYQVWEKLNGMYGEFANGGKVGRRWMPPSAESTAGEGQISEDPE